MATHVSHAALPYPIKNARFTVGITLLDSSGVPTDAVTPDSEFSLDGGASADCAEEVTAISGMTGAEFLTLTGAETNGSILAVQVKRASGPQVPIIWLYPRVLPVIYSGIASAGAAGTITLAGTPARANILAGAIVMTTGGTGGGGTGGANNQARIITSNTAALVASVAPNWETTPDNTTTFNVLATEGWVAKLTNSLGIAAGRSVTGTLSVNTFTTDQTYTNTDQLVGRTLLFLTGNNALVARRVDEVTTGGLFRVRTLPAAPANGDEWIVL